MSNEMSRARFVALADAYGGDLGRWPGEERTMAFAFAATSDGARILAEATTLDAGLDRFAVPPPSSELEERILASAPHQRSMPGRMRLRRWLGLTAVGVAGAATGALAVAAVPNVAGSRLEPAYEQTAFGNLNGEGEE